MQDDNLFVSKYTIPLILSLLTNTQFNADVLACNVNSITNMVEALDTWNDQNQRFNIIDGIQNTDLRNGTFSNGRIQCV